MKKLLPILVIVAVALPITAAPSRAARMKSAVITSPKSEPVSADVVAHLLDEWNAARDAKRGGARVNAITDVRSSRALVIPAAGSTAGGGGALFFRSDVTLVNYE